MKDAPVKDEKRIARSLVIEKQFVVSVLRAVSASLRTKQLVNEFVKHKNKYLLMVLGVMKTYENDDETV